MNSPRFMIRFFWSMTLVLPLVVIWIGAVVFAYFTDRPLNFNEEFTPRMMQSIVMTIPLIILAFFAQSKAKHLETLGTIEGLKAAGFTVLCGTIFLWGFLYYVAVVNTGGGVNFGIVFIIMLSPIYLPGLMYLGFYIGRWLFKKKHTENSVTHNGA